MHNLVCGVIILGDMVVGMSELVDLKNTWVEIYPLLLLPHFIFL